MTARPPTQHRLRRQQIARRVRARRKARKLAMLPTGPLSPRLADLLQLPDPPPRLAYAPTETAVAVRGRTRAHPASPR